MLKAGIRIIVGPACFGAWVHILLHAAEYQTVKGTALATLVLGLLLWAVFPLAWRFNDWLSRVMRPWVDLI